MGRQQFKGKGLEWKGRSEDRQACHRRLLLHAAGCPAQSLAAFSSNAQPTPCFKLLTKMQFSQ